MQFSQGRYLINAAYQGSVVLTGDWLRPLKGISLSQIYKITFDLLKGK
jgi:hypothetical protein